MALPAASPLSASGPPLGARPPQYARAQPPGERMPRRFEGRDLLIASHNPGKVAEIRDLLRPWSVAVKASSELALPEPEETGSTFVENAQIKARDAAVGSGLRAEERRVGKGGVSTGRSRGAPDH